MGMTTNTDPQQQLNSETTNSNFVADNAGVPNIPNAVNAPVGFSAEGSLPHPANEVAFGPINFSAQIFLAFDILWKASSS